MSVRADSRQVFIDAACGQVPPTRESSIIEKLQFTSVNEALRDILRKVGVSTGSESASSSLPSRRASPAEEGSIIRGTNPLANALRERRALCQRLVMEMLRNPALASSRMTEREKNLAVEALGYSLDKDVRQQPGQPIVPAGEQRESLTGAAGAATKPSFSSASAASQKRSSLPRSDTRPPDQPEPEMENRFEPAPFFGTAPPTATREAAAAAARGVGTRQISGGRAGGEREKEGDAGGELAASVCEREPGQLCTSASALRRLAWYALFGGTYAAGLALAPAPVLGATLPLLSAALVARWGRPHWRTVASYFTDKRHVGGMRRALSTFSTGALGGENTFDLRDRFVRYATLDAEALDHYIRSLPNGIEVLAHGGDGSTYPTGSSCRNAGNAGNATRRGAPPAAASAVGDGTERKFARDLNEYLYLSILERYRADRRRRGVRSPHALADAVGHVLADFTFGPSQRAALSSLQSSNAPLLPSLAFIPTAVATHVGLRGAKDVDEYAELHRAFASGWFRPALDTDVNDEELLGEAALPHDVRRFWNESLAYALDQRHRHAVADDLLYTMYYFVWRYAEAHHLLRHLRCPEVRAARLQQASSMEPRASADVLLACIFSDYEERFRSTLSVSDSVLHRLGLSFVKSCKP